jgi:hypothetical protein
MREIVINVCHGGFGLSHEAIMMYSELAHLNLSAIKTESSFTPYAYYLDGIESDEHFWSEYNLKRDDPDLVRVVKHLREAANEKYAELKIVSIPDDVKWHIAEYDGMEHVAEDHRTWS